MSEELQHRHAEVNGVRLHYVTAGSGPPMLFLHGFPEYWAAWRAQLSEFARDHTVIAPDQRGYNLSAKPEAVKAYRPGVLVEDLRALLAHLGIARCTVVAHDWGGAIAWNFAIAHPQLVERLVIINAPHPIPWVRELANNPAQQRASDYMAWFRRSDAEARLMADDYAQLLELFGEGLGARDGGAGPTPGEYRAAWSQPGALTAMLNWYRASPVHPPTPDEPGAAALALDPARFTVRVPTLVIWGERDRVLLPGVLEGLEQVVPDLRIERIAEGTHWVVHQFPQRVNQLIRAFAGSKKQIPATD